VDIFHLNTNHRYVHDQLMASLKHLISRNLRAVIHRQLEGKPKTCTLKRDGDQWFASIVYEIEIADPPPRATPIVALDRGVVNVIADSDGNIVVSKTATSDNVTFDLADNITVTSVTAGGTVLDASGLTIAGGPSVTTVGIDAGGTVITNVAPGAVSSTSTDAVNGSQLFAVSEVANAGWNISDGTTSGNIAPDETLTVAAGSNAEVTYDDATSTLTVGVVADPSFNSITVGDTVINDGSVSFTSGGPSLTMPTVSSSIRRSAQGVRSNGAVRPQSSTK